MYKNKYSKYIVLIFTILIVLGIIAANYYVRTRLPKIYEKAIQPLPTPSPNLNQLDENGLPKGFVSFDFVKSRPEAKLKYPNSKLIQEFGGAEESSIDGKNSAFTGGIYATNDSPDKVYLWYENQLTKANWVVNRVYLMTTMLSAHGYKRGSREFFLIAVEDPETLSQRIGTKFPSNQNVFEYRYSISPFSH